ncbi:CHAP domain-containing protein [Enterococcus faecalis]
MFKIMKTQIFVVVAVLLLFLGMIVTTGSDEQIGLGGADVQTGVLFTYNREKVQSFLNNYPYLKDKLPSFERVAKKYNIDIVLMIAIILQETGGNSPALIEHNNPSGQMIGSTILHFNTLDEGLDMTGKTLNNLINERGLKTIESLGATYAPVGAANDPTGLNNQWIPSVKKFVELLGGTPVLTPGGGPAGQINNEVISRALGTRVENGQCYGWTAMYVRSLGGPELMGSGKMNASDIGSDYPWEQYGFQVIFAPSFNQLKAGDVINWRQGGIALSVYGHTGVITSVGKDGQFQTVEQNAEQGEIVAQYNRSMDSGIIQSVVRKVVKK